MRGDAGCRLCRPHFEVLRDERFQKLKERGEKAEREREREKSCRSSSAHPLGRALGLLTGAGLAPSWRLSCPSLPRLPLVLPVSAPPFPLPQPQEREPLLSALSPPSPNAGPGPPRCPASSLQLPAARGAGPCSSQCLYNYQNPSAELAPCRALHSINYIV